MARLYELNGGLGGAAMSSSNKSLIAVIATAAVRPAVYDLTFGTIGTPADNVVQVTVARASAMTAGSNNTTTVSNPLNSGDPASTSTGGAAWTTEPTVGVTLLSIGLNQRATYRWAAAPGSELVSPATANNGIIVRSLSPAYTGDAQTTILFSE